MDNYLKNNEKPWREVGGLLRGSLERLGVSLDTLKKVSLEEEVRRDLLRDYPSVKERLEVQLLNNDKMVIKVENHYLAQEIMLSRSNDLKNRYGLRQVQVRVVRVGG